MSAKFKMKPNHLEFIKAASKIQKYLQDEENLKRGRKAKSISYIEVTKYIYDNYMRGKQIK